MKVLVIDDSRTTRLIIKRILSELGHEVVEAPDGRQGLSRVRDESPAPALVLVDWNMPDMNGLEFIVAVRADAAHDSLPIVMVTTETELANVERALAAGANEYLMKPFDRDTLTSKLAILGL